MIKPLIIGSMSFPVNIIQGPLAGISCAPFRALTFQYGKPAFSCTEMISCKTLIHKPIGFQKRYIEKSSNEGPVCFQLASNNPDDLAEACKRVTDYGADLIDLNCGCPVKKIRSKGAGSGLLTQPKTLYHLIQAMKKNTHVPVSIKIRVEKLGGEKFHQELVNVVSDAGADFITVHGRHWTEHYDKTCRHEEIQFFVEALKIPVIGNGDVACVDSLKTMLNTGCAGVMISRAGVGQPWLIKKLIGEMNNENFVMPTLAKIGEIFIEHVSQLIQLLNNEKYAILQARKFAKYYGRSLETKKNFCEEMNHCTNLEDLQEICARYFC